MALSSFLDSLSAYPRWLVIAGATAAAVIALWILVKLLRLALWLGIVVILVVGTVLLVANLVR